MIILCIYGTGFALSWLFLSQIGNHADNVKIAFLEAIVWPISVLIFSFDVLCMGTLFITDEEYGRPGMNKARFFSELANKFGKIKKTHKKDLDVKKTLVKSLGRSENRVNDTLNEVKFYAIDKLATSLEIPRDLATLLLDFSGVVDFPGDFETLETQYIKERLGK